MPCFLNASDGLGIMYQINFRHGRFPSGPSSISIGPQWLGQFVVFAFLFLPILFASFLSITNVQHFFPFFISDSAPMSNLWLGTFANIGRPEYHILPCLWRPTSWPANPLCSFWPSLFPHVLPFPSHFRVMPTFCPSSWGPEPKGAGKLASKRGNNNNNNKNQAGIMRGGKGQMFLVKKTRRKQSQLWWSGWSNWKRWIWIPMPFFWITSKIIKLGTWTVYLIGKIVQSNL